MRADRAAAGLSGAAILVVLAVAPGGLAVMEYVLLVLAGVVVVGTFAPVLPVLHGLPVVGAPRVRAYVNFGTDAPMIAWRYGSLMEDRVLRVGFKNEGPRRVEGALINVLVDAPIEIVACDHAGRTLQHGSSMPDTSVNGRLMRFWAESDLTLPVGSKLRHYRLSFPDADALGDSFLVRVTYGADDLYGSADRVLEEWVEIKGSRA